MARNQGGNILFMILLAIVLFAALAYAVTSSMRGSGKEGSSENIQAGAGAISQYVTLIRNEVNRLMLVNGCTAANLDWRHAFYTRYSGQYTNIGGGVGSAPAVAKTGCAVFQAFGGAISPQVFSKYPDKAYDAYYTVAGGSNVRTGHAFIRWVNRQNELTTANDIAILFDGLDKTLCAYLVNPQNPVLPSDGFDYGTDANAASPSVFTTAGDVVGNVPENTYGEFFASTVTYNGSETFCRLGAIILPQ